MNWDEKYKSCKYESTIKNVRSILSQVPIEVEERVSENYSNVYSARVTVLGTYFGTNGKGMSREAALASAYGELMERLQNLILFKKYQKSNLYVYVPDEEWVDLSSLQSALHIFSNALSEKPDLSLLNLIKDYCSDIEKEKDLYCCTPYINYFSGGKVIFPSYLLDFTYASNGMAAGNTIQEALLQGICEVFERYSNRMLLNGNICPPEIRCNEIQNEQIQFIAEKLLANGQFDLSIKDCSLGLGLPVVAIILLNKKTGKYFVKFGSHPVMQVAINRAISELFQGRTLFDSEIWMRTFSFDNNYTSLSNFEKIFRSGDGDYPFILFDQTSTYVKKDDWYKSSDVSNEKMLEYLLEIIKRNQWTLYYRDVSFLNFPSVHVLIPEIGYINCINSKTIKQFMSYQNEQRLIKNLKSCSDYEKKEILAFVKNNNYKYTSSIDNLVGADYLHSEQQKMSIGFLCFLLYNSMGMYSEAYQALLKLIKEKGNGIEKKEITLRVVKEYFFAKHMLHESPDRIRKFLSRVYPMDIIDKAVDIVENPDSYLCNICDNDCGQCINKENCCLEKINDIHDIISQRYVDWVKRRN